jgi:hypothetical protein
MHQAWLKSVLLQVTLWTYPYIKEGDFYRHGASSRFLRYT